MAPQPPPPASFLLLTPPPGPPRPRPPRPHSRTRKGTSLPGPRPPRGRITSGAGAGRACAGCPGAHVRKAARARPRAASARSRVSTPGSGRRLRGAGPGARLRRGRPGLAAHRRRRAAPSSLRPPSGPRLRPPSPSGNVWSQVTCPAAPRRTPDLQPPHAPPSIPSARCGRSPPGGFSGTKGPEAVTPSSKSSSTKHCSVQEEPQLFMSPQETSFWDFLEFPAQSSSAALPGSRLTNAGEVGSGGRRQTHPRKN